MNEATVPILVCPCGKRLKAPGAKPGRVGRCPSCGGTMRVPVREGEHEAVATLSAPSTAAAMPADIPVASKKRKKRRGSQGQETAIWDGFVKPPTQLETTIPESLLYPLWGAQGVVSLILFPPVLAVVAAMLIGAVKVWSGRGTPFDLIVLISMILPVLALGFVLGFLLLYLARILASSAVGEIRPPRWPEWELSSLYFGMGRWLWAGLIGVVVGGIPAIAYWIRCGDVDLFDTIILTELLAAGAVYALMALLIAILHEDILAANPVAVFVAIRRVGWSYLQPCLLCGFACLTLGTVLTASFALTDAASSAFLFWLFWVMAIYETMVVFRVFGLFYRKHARKLGWFHGRTRWGV